MAVADRRCRTNEILQRHGYAQQRITGGLPVSSVAQAASLEGLACETVRLLRENKTMCVREERACIRALLGDEGDIIDVGYTDAKAEIDRVVQILMNDRAELRVLRQRLSTPSRPRSIPAPNSTLVDYVQRLAKLYRDGLLNADEFAAAKARLL